MKIVNKEQFLQLPKGILYSKYEHPMIIEGLAIKRKTFDEKSWQYQDLLGEIMELETETFQQICERMKDSESKGLSVKMDYDCADKEVIENDEQLFLIYEIEDVLNLKNEINKIWSQYPNL